MRISDWSSDVCSSDLRLSDFQLGLLGGPAFAVLYTILGFPIAKWAERGNRVTIIAVALATWSTMTALCGAAMSYTQLFAARVGVSIGEAGCAPPAHSLIAEYFPRERRATAMSTYAVGAPLGMMVRSEEHTSELQSLMRISYAVFCLQKNI